MTNATTADALADAIQAEKAARSEYQSLNRKFQTLKLLLRWQEDRLRTAHCVVVELEARFRNEA